MKTMLRKLSLLLVIGLLTAVTATSALASNRQSILDTAEAAGQFNTLLFALEATGLDAVLADESTKFTVFAPTDAAFAALGQDTIDALVADPDTLSDILLYHVRAGEGLKEGRLLGEDFVHMANGVRVKVTVDNGVFINDSQVVVTDILATNGVIHVIDSVLIPPKDILGIAEDAGLFNTLLFALDATGLDAALADQSTDFTVFAPTDDAFAALGQDTIDALVADPDALSNVLLYHVKIGQFFDEDLLRNRNRTRMANGDRVEITQTADGFMINDSKIIISSIVARNGLIHVIDAVLIPPSH